VCPVESTAGISQKLFHGNVRAGLPRDSGKDNVVLKT